MAGLMLAPLMNSYNVSKAGVIALSETMNHEFIGTGVNVCVVCPAFFQTNLTSSMRSSIPGIQKNVDKLMQRSSVTADDVANDIARAVRKGQFWSAAAQDRTPALVHQARQPESIRLPAWA